MVEEGAGRMCKQENKEQGSEIASSVPHKAAVVTSSAAADNRTGSEPEWAY